MASHNIAQNLRDNNTNWQNVKQAIEDKGVSTTGLTTAEYDDAIRQISGGSEPVLDSVNITPSTVSQTITPPTGTDGYNEINVAAVDNTIDANIVAENIKNGVQILGITGNYSGQSGNYQAKSVAPAATEQIVAPDSGYDALSQVTVGAAPLQNKSVSPSTSQQSVSADSPNYGLGTVTVGAVDASIDSNITPQNIRKDIQILGITGVFEGATDVEVPFSQSKAYSDSSPVTYEWVLGANVDTINITNADEGGGVWNKPTASNLSVSVKRTESGSYETLTEGTDYTLTVTGTSSGNYIYNIEIVCNSYIYSVKVVYTNIYRVRGRLDTNKILNIEYSNVAPSSTTGFNVGDLWFVVNANNIVTNQYMFNGTAWVEEEIGAEILSTSVDFLQEPTDHKEEILLEYNGKLCIIDRRDIYEYDETNNQFVSVYTASEDLVENNEYTNCCRSVMLGKNLYIENSNSSGIVYIDVINFETHVKTRLLYNPTGPSNAIESMCSDGTYLYLADRANLKLWKIDIATLAISELAVLTRYYTSMVYRDGYIYGVLGDYVDKIDVSDGTITALFNTSTNTDKDTYRTLVADSDYIYLIGGKNSLNKVLRFNDSNYVEYVISSEQRACKAVIYKGDLYALNNNILSSDRMIRILGRRLNKNTFISGSQLGTEISTKGIKKVTVVS